MEKFAEIIARVEQVRVHFGMNKSKFSASIGMKAQTYNNFIGAQGSKPNIELLHGIVDHFGVHPFWLLTGGGSMFMSKPEDGRTVAAERTVANQVPANSDLPRTLHALRESPAFARIAEILSNLDSCAAPSRSERITVMDRVTKAIADYLVQYPDQARSELIALLERVEQRLAERQADN